MTANWVVDAQDRPLPEPGWPPERAAPGDLELLRRFCNSINHENGADRFSTSAGFDDWLRAEGRRATRPNRHDLARVVAFRTAMHTITRARHDHDMLPAAWAALAGTVADVTYRLDATAGGLRLVSEASSPTAAFLGELALVCKRAADDGSLLRLKACAHCQWIIYDASKNQSGRWCAMNICGARHNARAYRQRHRGVMGR